MSYFEDTRITIEEYEKPKINYSEEWDKMFNLEQFNEGMIIPFMKRLSCAKCNVKQMEQANEYFFTIDKGVLSRFITLNKNNGFKFMKSLKKTDKDDKFNFLIEAIMKYYGWTDREYQIHKDFVNLMDSELHQTLHNLYGFDKKECKVLGITNEKMKIKFEKVVKQIGWF